MWKAGPRSSHEPEVTWQEIMELVAALLNEHPKKDLPKDRVTLLAQDECEMYILDAVYTDGYRQHVEYIHGRGPRLKQSDFLRIYRYGPYMITDRDDVEYFAKLALAVALRASEEEDRRS